MGISLSEVELPIGLGGSQILPNPDELRMLINISCSEGKGAKVLIREGKNPDLLLRSLNLR